MAVDEGCFETASSPLRQADGLLSAFRSNVDWDPGDFADFHPSGFTSF
jgi:hypothetical protein